MHSRTRVTVAHLSYGKMGCMKRSGTLVLVALLLLIAAPPPAAALDEADRLWLVGERALADELYPLARRVLERFVDRYPRDTRAPEGLYLLGKARMALNEPEPALDAFRRARATSPSAAPWRLDARFWEGEALFRLKRFADARAAYDDVIKTDASSPRAPEALYGMGFADIEMQRPERAATTFRDFLKAWPDHALAPSARFYVGRALLDMKRYDEAATALAEFAAKHPDHKMAGEARYLIGWSRMTAGDTRMGLADLRAFVSAYPSHPSVPEARRMIVQGLAQSSDETELQEAYRALIAQTPLTPDTLAEAASLAARANKPADQEAALRKLRTEFPDHPFAVRASFELATAAFGRKEWEDAAALAEAAASAKDDKLRAEALLLAGESELKLKRFSAALRSFEAVGTIADVEPSVRYRALAGSGIAHEEQQSWKPALAAYEAVGEQNADETLRDWARGRAKEVQARIVADQKKAAGERKKAPDREKSSPPPAKPPAKKP